MKYFNVEPIQTISKRRLFLAALLIAGIFIGMVFYGFKLVKVKTYYIAYVGRYSQKDLDSLHELALRRYIAEFNAKSSNVRLELETFNNEESYFKSREIYERISEDRKYLVVIDNTWGKELQPLAGFIREKDVPVIAINADKQTADFSYKTVFLGADDNVPQDISEFTKQILQKREVIFIAEANYGLTAPFLREMKICDIQPTSLYVNSKDISVEERNRLFQEIEESINELSKIDEHPTVILNTHANWGVEIINFIDRKFRNVEIIGGPYIVNWSKAGQFGLNANGNSVIILTIPSDAINNRVYMDLQIFRKENPELTKIVNAQLFVKRSRDAFSLIRKVIDEQQNSAVSRSDFIEFFADLANNEYIDSEDLYKFDDNLRLSVNRSFEKHFQGRVYSYLQQLNTHKKVIPNIDVGLEVIDISDVDTTSRSFRANFFFWLRYDNRHNKMVEQSIHFRNKKDSDKPELVHSENINANTVYKLYRMSGEFSMEVDYAKYPLDTQEIKIEIELINPSDNLRISFDHKNFDMGKNQIKNFSLGEWIKGDLYVSVDNFITNSLHGSSVQTGSRFQRFETLNVRMPIHRNWTVPFVTIILPLIMMGIVAIFLLCITDNSFSNVGGACIGIFICLIGYSVGFAQLTPKTNVLTIMDLLFYGTFIFVFLIFIKIIILNSGILNEKHQKMLNEYRLWIGGVVLTTYIAMLAASAVIELW